jgi:hypothetical protein
MDMSASTLSIAPSNGRGTAITQACLRELFTLDEDTGVLRWRRESRLGRIKAGDVAGYLHNHKTTGTRWRIKIKDRTYARSRLVFLYVHGWLPEMVDHKDRNTLNDRPDNLRAANSLQNTFNKGARKGKPSGLPKGVTLIKGKRHNPFLAQISIDGHLKKLGRFPTPELAHAAYVKAAIETRGEFACVA